MKKPHPAWLISAAIASVSAATLLGALGCARFSCALPPVARHVFGTTSLTSGAATSGSDVQLTSGALHGVGRLCFASSGVADIPVEQLLAAGDRPLPMNGLCPPDMA